MYITDVAHATGRTTSSSSFGGGLTTVVKVALAALALGTALALATPLTGIALFACIVIGGLALTPLFFRAHPRTSPSWSWLAPISRPARYACDFFTAPPREHIVVRTSPRNDRGSRPVLTRGANSERPRQTASSSGRGMTSGTWEKYDRTPPSPPSIRRQRPSGVQPALTREIAGNRRADARPSRGMPREAGRNPLMSRRTDARPIRRRGR